MLIRAGSVPDADADIGYLCWTVFSCKLLAVCQTASCVQQAANESGRLSPLQAPRLIVAGGLRLASYLASKAEKSVYTFLDQIILQGLVSLLLPIAEEACAQGQSHAPGAG